MGKLVPNDPVNTGRICEFVGQQNVCDTEGSERTNLGNRGGAESPGACGKLATDEFRRHRGLAVWRQQYSGFSAELRHRCNVVVDRGLFHNHDRR